MTYFDSFIQGCEGVGYTMLDNRENGGVSVVSEAFDQAASNVTELAGNANLDEIRDRIASLTQFHVTAIGIAHRSMLNSYPGVHLLALREPPELVISAEVDFVTTAEMWAASFKLALPRLQLSDAAKSAIEGLVGSVSSNPVLTAGLNAVLSLASGPGQVNLLSVVAWDNPAPAFVADWSSTVISRQPPGEPWVEEYLWDAVSNSVVAPESTFLNRPDANFFGSAEHLQAVLRSASGE